MRGLGRFGVWAASLFITVGSIASHDASAEPARFDNIIVNVASVPANNFTYSTADQLSINSYTFYLQNNKSTYLNNATFRASVSAGEFDTAPDFCTVSADKKSISCPVSSVAPNAEVTFEVLVKSPTSGTATELVLNWNIRYGSGTSETYYAGAVTLQSNSTTAAEGATNTNALFVVTGNGVPRAKTPDSPGDPFTAAAKVDPNDGTFVVTSIKEYSNETGAFPDTTPCSPNAKKCVQFSVKKLVGTVGGEPDTAPAVFPADLAAALYFTVRVDASEVVGKSINQSYLTYYPDGGGAVAVLDCPKRQLTPYDYPCILEKFVWTKGAAQKVGEPELIGDWQYLLWSSKNGFVDTSW